MLSFFFVSFWSQYFICEITITGFSGWILANFGKFSGWILAGFGDFSGWILANFCDFLGWILAKLLFK